ncbi:uncharacterized protein LOC126564071 [Anopheles maculipalpis]|uniref:uncharacterized protein LOC126564071 n=1 Tax=Anopheles maculipalpis TaxID=1496333 RepID=UPI002158E76F|nr:uncharacterized protein LOC126564071 [Anopheles maculipalpis]
MRMTGTMKPSPKKSSSSKVKQRTKSSSSNSNNNNNNNSSILGTNQQHLSGTLAGSAPSSNSSNNQTQQQLSHPPQKQAIPQSDSSGNDASNMGSSKEKSSYKSYAGLSSRSVRTAWEQHDKQETEVAPDVYTKLAEDATYKLWEFANSIKTYSRHSSGRVTFDLVNEVLKDSDVPPIVGANSQPWDKIEYDGAYFFNSDEVLDLREEYIKHISLEQHNVPVLTTTWMAESDIAEDLIAMHNNICDSIFIGDEACFNAAIDILQYNQHTPSLMKLLLTKAIEMLGFEYTEETLRRALEYLEALAQNCHVAHSDLTLELSLLSQLFVNLLLGPAGFVHAKLLQPNDLVQRSVPTLAGTVPQQQSDSDQQQQQQQQQQQVLDNISPLFNSSMALLENNLPPAEDSNNSNSNATEELLRSIENIKDGADGIDLNIKDEYEALFSMVQGLGKQEGVDDGTMVGTESLAETVVDGFQVKTEFDPEAYDANASNFIVQQAAGTVAGGHTEHPTAALHDPGMLTSEMLNSLAASAVAAAAVTGTAVNSDGHMTMFDLKPDASKSKLLESSTTATLLDADPEENVSLPMSESSDGGGEVNNPNSTTLESENITTLICEDYLVDSVCRVIGLCASKWGFVEQECTFLLVERLQRYFQERKTVALDYNWLARIFRGLWAIGEFALRELVPYFYHIDSQSVPEYLVPHFSAAGIFLNGRSDIFFYEYLYDVCGDSLAPFTFSYDQYIEKLYLKYHKQRVKTIAAKNCYKVVAKVVPTRLPPSYTPRPSTTSKLTLQVAFEDYSEKRLPSVGATNQPPKPRIGFRFPGCRSIPLKTCSVRTATANSMFPIMEVANVGLKQNTALFKSFNSKTVVARRRLLMPVTNEPPKRRVFGFGSCML